MPEHSKVELEKLAMPALQHAELVDLARNHSPNRVYEIASLRWPRRQAKAVRFLAILRRNHGTEAFDAFITSVEHARPKGAEHAQGGKRMVKTLWPTYPQFLYPTSRQYPMDEVCERIVRELEARNWSVPGITVEFDTYGTGAERFRLVRMIKGADFRIYFCRKQRTMPGSRWNDTAAVNGITIPKQQISVYHDESGPSYVLYVGKDWEKDRDWFMHAAFVNSKLCDEPRRYLRYRGAWKKPYEDGPSYIFPGQRPPVLSHDNDLGREYEPKKILPWEENFVWDLIPDDYRGAKNFDAPLCLDTGKVMNHFVKWLTKHALAIILKHDLPKEQINIFAGHQPMPMPEKIGPIFAFGEWRDAERIKTGQSSRHSGDLQPADQYGMIGSGYRLIDYGVTDDGSFPKLAYEGFLWCGLGEVTPETYIRDLEIPGHHRWSDREQFVLRITPNSADDIYIVDWYPYEEARQATFANPKKERATDEEVGEWKRAAARTMIPITEYRGDFKKPLILICRDLGFDEVEVVSGPWKGNITN